MIDIKITRTSVILILSVMALCGCNNQNNVLNENVNIDVNSNVGVSSNNDAADVKIDDTEVYYCDIVNDSVSKYPELNTIDVVIDEYGFGPMIVSPYASDDVVKAVAHVIYETNIEAYCYGNYLFDKYSDNFAECDFDEVYAIIQKRVDEARIQADSNNNNLISSIENDSMINISPDGEYYYILDMDNFEESAKAIQISIDKQSDVFDFDMQFYCEYYFSHEGRTFTGGYRGPTYSIYLNSYSTDNKIYEYYYWKAKNEWVDIYTDLYTLMIYDYTQIGENLNSQTDNRKKLTCSSCLYQNSQDTGLYSINYSYRMYSDDFDLSEAIEFSYEVYTNVCSANEEYNTNMICGMYIDINNFTEYEKEYDSIYVFIPFEEDYSFDEFEKIITDSIEMKIEDEPV